MRVAFPLIECESYQFCAATKIKFPSQNDSEDWLIEAKGAMVPK